MPTSSRGTATSTTRTLRALALVLIAGLLFAACGSSGSSSSEDPGTDGTAVASDAFPVTIEHKYGTTEIGQKPVRVVSVGFQDQDPLLALGVVPVGIRDWFGDQ